MKTLLAFVSLTVNSLGFPFLEPPTGGNEIDNGHAYFLGNEECAIVMVTGEYQFTYFTLRGDRPIIGLAPNGLWVRGD